MQALRNTLIIISAFLSLTFFIKCASSIPTDKDIEQKAIFVANDIDGKSLDLLKNFTYGIRGDNDFWLRGSLDTSLYACSYKLVNDTVKLTIWRPFNFSEDFSTVYKFDTSIYSQYSFFQVDNEIVKIELDSNNGNSCIKDTSAPINQFFTGKNPFSIFSELTKLKNKYSFIGSSYNSTIGDIFVFWLSPKFKLEYLPDTTKVGNKYWLQEFKKGKQIKRNWSLINVYEE
jgi:hypothetical protein